MGIDSKLQERVQAMLDEQVANGDHVGVQMAAYRNGKLLVSAFAGEMGPEDARPVQGDTLFSCFSTTKGVAATALHILADRGQIDYDATVASYWPKFGQHGKEKITVAQAMTHQSGLHAVPRPLTTEFIMDWDAGLKWIEDGVPAWEPGTATGYHALTYAWVVGGIVQHATGRHIKDVIQEEIARPLGIEGEMYVGIPDGVEARLATLKTGDPEEAAARRAMMQIPADHPMLQAMPPDSQVDYNDMRVRKACLPSANGHFTARALAKMYGALANGGEIEGVRLVSAERIPLMQRVYTSEPDRVIMMPLRKGIGFFMGGKSMGPTGVFGHGATGPRETAFGHPGAGGSIAFADPEVGLSMAVTINKMQTTLTAEGPVYQVCELIRDELGVNG